MRSARDDDGRPPICPACGVTMTLAASERPDRELAYVCLECGFADDRSDT